VIDVEVGCLRASRNFLIVGSQLVDGDHSHGWLILAIQL